MTPNYPPLYLIDGNGQSVTLLDTGSFIKHGALARGSDSIPLEAAKNSLPIDSIIFANVDPFSNLRIISQALRLLPFRKVANVSDTHHGILPITRLAYFCTSTGIDSIILRFNHRHSCWFERLGISTFSTIISPDLSQLIDEGILSATASMHRENNVVHVGSFSKHHIFRTRVHAALQDLSVVSWRRFSDVRKMLLGMSRYKSSLNVSLNLDFNRRVIESMMAGCQLISDELEDSQFFYPLSLLKPHIFWYNNMKTLIGFLADCCPLTKSPQDLISIIYDSGYDRKIREALISMPQHFPAKLTPMLLDIYLGYDYLQDRVKTCSLTNDCARIVGSFSLRHEKELSDSISSLVKTGLQRSVGFV